MLTTLTYCRSSSQGTIVPYSDQAEEIGDFRGFAPGATLDGRYLLRPARFCWSWRPRWISCMPKGSCIAI